MTLQQQLWSSRAIPGCTRNRLEAFKADNPTFAEEDLRGSKSSAPLDKQQSMLSVAQAGGQTARDQLAPLFEELKRAKEKVDKLQKGAAHEQGRAKTCGHNQYRFAVEEYEKKKAFLTAEWKKMAGVAREFKLKSSTAPGEAGGRGAANQGQSRNARRNKRRRDRADEGQQTPQPQQQQANAAKEGIKSMLRTR